MGGSDGSTSGTYCNPDGVGAGTRHLRINSLARDKQIQRKTTLTTKEY